LRRYIKVGSIEPDTVDKRRRAAEGKLVTDHSEAAAVERVYVETCRGLGRA
jgi:hypothetical protein